MAAGIETARFGAADFVHLQLRIAQFTDRWQAGEAAAAQPFAARCAAQPRLHPKIVKNHQTVITRELNIEFGRVVSGFSGSDKSRQGVFRPQLCPATVGNIERIGHVPYSRRKEKTVSGGRAAGIDWSTDSQGTV